MADRNWTIFPGMALGLLVVLAALVTGCGTPRERYRVLSVFFDGVPNPDAPKTRNTTDATGATRVITAAIVSQHKPFINNECAACHRTNAGEIQDFSEAYKACVKCHTKISNSLPLMHGPVAREACKYCHAPHESTQPHLLKDDPVKVCTQCHDQQLLWDKPPQHLDGTTSCLDCHYGHGGRARYFIKPSPGAPPPAASPTPATAPRADSVPDATAPPVAAVDALPAGGYRTP